MAIVFNDMGDLKNAIEAYDTAISIKPDYTEAWCNCADALDNWNKLDQLKIWVENASSYEVVPADIKVIKAQLLWRSKQFKEMSSFAF